MMVQFGDGLPQIETINVYGASNDPESPHYEWSGWELFLAQKLKTMSLDKAEVMKNAQRGFITLESKSEFIGRQKDRSS